MSTIKLPELPTVQIGKKKISQVWFREHEVRTYAEEAVRQALAAQQTVAWLREVTPGGGVWRHYVSLEEPISGFPAIERKHRLAIIPESSNG